MRDDRRRYKQCLLRLQLDVRAEMRTTAKRLGCLQSELVEAALEDFFSLPDEMALERLAEMKASVKT